MKKLFAVFLLIILVAASITAQKVYKVGKRFDKLEKKYANNPASLNDRENDEYHRGLSIKYPIDIGELDDEVNIDSLFVITIASLKTNINSITLSKYMNNREGMFLGLVLTITKDEKISAIDVGTPHHMPRIKLSDVELIEEWYLDHKEKLTWETIQPAYNVIYRHMRMTFDQWLDATTKEANESYRID